LLTDAGRRTKKSKSDQPVSGPSATHLSTSAAEDDSDTTLPTLSITRYAAQTCSSNYSFPGYDMFLKNIFYFTYSSKRYRE